MVESEILYKVVKVGRISRRRQILRRNVSKSVAKSIVASYPDSRRSMVFFTAMKSV